MNTIYNEYSYVICPMTWDCLYSLNIIEMYRYVIQKCDNLTYVRYICNLMFCFVNYKFSVLADLSKYLLPYLIFIQRLFFYFYEVIRIFIL